MIEVLPEAHAVVGKTIGQTDDHQDSPMHDKRSLRGSRMTARNATLKHCIVRLPESRAGSGYSMAMVSASFGRVPVDGQQQHAAESPHDEPLKTVFDLPASLAALAL